MLWSYENTFSIQRIIFFWDLKKKIRLLCISVVLFWRISTGRLLRLFMLWFEWKQRIRVAWLTQNSIRSLRPVNVELLNKVVIFVFFAYKKYSRSFITFRLNHWWQMEYSDDVFHTLLGLDSVKYLAVNGTSLPVFIQNILNCVSKMNEALWVWNDMGEVINDKMLILGWSIPLTDISCKRQNKSLSV